MSTAIVSPVDRSDQGRSAGRCPIAGIATVASVACSFEEYLMNTSPNLTLTFDSMATGADRCCVRFERHLEATS